MATEPSSVEAREGKGAVRGQAILEPDAVLPQLPAATDLAGGGSDRAGPISARLGTGILIRYLALRGEYLDLSGPNFLR